MGIHKLSLKKPGYIPLEFDLNFTKGFFANSCDENLSACYRVCMIKTSHIEENKGYICLSHCKTQLKEPTIVVNRPNEEGGLTGNQSLVFSL